MSHGSFSFFFRLISRDIHYSKAMILFDKSFVEHENFLVGGEKKKTFFFMYPVFQVPYLGMWLTFACVYKSENIF